MHPSQAHIRWQFGIGTEQPGEPVACSVGIEMRHLFARMDAGIGSPRTDDFNRLVGDRTQSALERFLDTLGRGLLLPAAVGSAVVLDANRNASGAAWRSVGRSTQCRERGLTW